MATKKKLLQAAAGQAGGGALNVEDVFSTYLYEGAAIGSGDIQIQNNLDLSGEGGLVWTKGRSLTTNHFFTDTERGGTKSVFSNLTNAEATNANLMSFNSDGFTLGSGAVGWTAIAGNGEDYASWTFRKAPKFFDVVTYTGDGVAGRTVSHNLGSVPGCIIVKVTSAGGNWVVYHRGTDATAPEDYGTKLSSTAAREDNVVFWNDTAPTSTEFTVGTGSLVNTSGATYVAYLFAHNDGDGEFGPDGDADIIKCGSFNRAGAYASVDVNLGFEPQFLIVKTSGTTGNWKIVDNMRGMTESSASTAKLYSNDPSAEVLGGDGMSAKLNATGFSVADSTTGDHIYIAIRRGPMAVPESATDVFDIDTHDSTEPLYDTSFPVDFGMYRRPDLTQGMYLGSRMQGAKELRPNATSKEDNNPYHLWDYQNGWGATGAGSSGSYSWMWRRAPNFFDVVAYTGNGTAGRNISHNLGVAPEMIWVKRRNSVSNWSVYHSDVGNTKYLVLNTTNAPATFNYWNNTDPTATTFGVSSSGAVNASGDTYIAYLFASVDGVSKLGTFTTTSGALDVDCGFSSGARFVLLKKTNGAEDWVLFDSERGIVSGNDPYLALNDTYAEVTSGDPIDPLSSGFTVNGSFWGSGNTYIFYAIA